MVKPDGSLLTAGHFVPAAEQMGIVHLVDRIAPANAPVIEDKPAKAEKPAKAQKQAKAEKPGKPAKKAAE